MRNFDVVVIGAGPYGLSLGAHLAGHGIDHCVFGPPMAFWRENMPPGMKLKSDGNSSDLPAPDRGFPLERFEIEARGTFIATQPITAEAFHAYGMEFRKRMVEQADPRMVQSVRADGSGFRIALEDGTQAAARAVVLAIGVRDFAYVPPALAALPAGLVSHSVSYGPVDALVGRRVAVIGSGASAIDLAASLHDAGASATIVTRRPTVAFHYPPARRPLRQRLRRPDSGIGGGWDLWFYANFPHLFHALPEALRLRIVDRSLGPAPGWFMRERIEGRVPMLTGVTATGLAADGDGVTIALQNQDGKRRHLVVDHVVAATGFRPDVARMTMLDPALRAAIRTAGTAPALSRRFETSVPGLFMIGPVAAPSFGPVMRFVFGAAATTPVVARALAARYAPAARTAPGSFTRPVAPAESQAGR